MPSPSAFSYAVVRVVPRVEREEFINAGVVLFCDALAFLDARVFADPSRLKALAPDVDMALVEEHLEVIPRVCTGGIAAGSIGELSLRERYVWLTAPRSTILQTSPSHAGLCADPRSELSRLYALLVAR